MLINGVLCDTYAHIDKKASGETVVLFADAEQTYEVSVFLFVNNAVFPVPESLTAECCINDVTSGTVSSTTTVTAAIGTHGEVIVTIPNSLRGGGKTLLCEINISDQDASGEAFRYKATNFRVSIIE